MATTLTIGPHRFPQVTFTGPAHDPPELLDGLPAPLAGHLRGTNGWIALGGALHVRGVCIEPMWHSLPVARTHLKRGYELGRKDVCFAQDGLGNQFVWRDDRVVRLDAETGRWQDCRVDIDGFFAAALAAPDRWLGHQYVRATPLAPGQLLMAYPPLCTAEAAQGVSLKPVVAAEVIDFHAALAAQLKDLPDGAPLRIKVT